MKNSNGTIGNRTRDLPTCSAVPQPNAPPLAIRDWFTCFENCHAHEETGRKDKNTFCR
jgi:hypothetical protein